MEGKAAMFRLHHPMMPSLGEPATKVARTRSPQTARCPRSPRPRRLRSARSSRSMGALPFVPLPRIVHPLQAEPADGDAVAHNHGPHISPADDAVAKRWEARPFECLEPSGGFAANLRARRAGPACLLALRNLAHPRDGIDGTWLVRIFVVPLGVTDQHMRKLRRCPDLISDPSPRAQASGSTLAAHTV
jgi:hypothetical protein